MAAKWPPNWVSFFQPSWKVTLSSLAPALPVAAAALELELEEPHAVRIGPAGRGRTDAEQAFQQGPATERVAERGGGLGGHRASFREMGAGEIDQVAGGLELAVTHPLAHEQRASPPPCRSRRKG